MNSSTVVNSPTSQSKVEQNYEAVEVEIMQISVYTVSSDEEASFENKKSHRSPILVANQSQNKPIEDYLGDNLFLSPRKLPTVRRS